MRPGSDATPGRRHPILECHPSIPHVDPVGAFFQPFARDVRIAIPRRRQPAHNDSAPALGLDMIVRPTPLQTPDLDHASGSRQFAS